MKRGRSLLWLFFAVAMPVGPVSAADDPPTAADVVRLNARITELEQELKEQRRLILNIMQSEQQRYEVLLQLMRSGAAGNPAALPPLPPVAPAPETRPAPPAEGGAPEAAPRARSGTVSGRVILPDGVKQAYVYVSGLRGRTGRADTVQIVQKNKQFSPQVLAVPVGTRLVFPNNDAIFHNVFSSTRGSAFDLGSQKGGDTSRPVTLSRAGHVEIFCNIHSQMRADVLVVSSGHYTRVEADGSFSIADVPAGRRQVVVWAPGIKPSSETVNVDGNGARIELKPERAAIRPHMNKVGQVYGSYDD